MRAGRRATFGQRLRASIVPCLRTTFVSGSMVLAVLVAIPCITIATALTIFRYWDPPGSMLILQQRIAGQTIDQRWVAFPAISPNLMRAVVASEDNQFCIHDGIDRKELAAVIEQADQWADEPSRGGSTITMQLAKNLFLWNSRSVVRKAIEIPIALGVERMWPKERILEVYLNIAEWGPGVFGAEAASQTYFHKPASRLTEREAALLAVALPNPLLRVPNRPSPHMLKVAGVVEMRARGLGRRAACLRGKAG
jgi:monofunctional glycosyltransferase